MTVNFERALYRPLRLSDIPVMTTEPLIDGSEEAVNASAFVPSVVTPLVRSLGAIQRPAWTL